MGVTVFAMKIALDSLLKKYPKRCFFEIETKAITTLSILITREATKRCLAKESVESILSYANKEITTTPCISLSMT